ncbi:MAG: SemiSWEET transporter [Steroidobacteraceae bacterium]|nr:SemiSWEET transporter [Deltaproteobacteria bacterium]
MSPTTIGLVAGALTSLAAIPQVIKTLRSRHVRDISIWQPLLLSIGVALWMFYGILIGDLPLIVANIIPLACNLLLTGMKLYYGKNNGSI